MSGRQQVNLFRYTFALINERANLSKIEDDVIQHVTNNINPHLIHIYLRLTTKAFIHPQEARKEYNKFSRYLKVNCVHIK